MNELDLEVSGMTCGHCERAVTTELREVAGVTEVTADAEAGRVRVAHQGDIDLQAIHAAVTAAGYAVEPSSPSA